MPDGVNAPGFQSHPGYEVNMETSPRRVRVEFGGEVIADSLRTLLVRETKHVPVYYFPKPDVRMDLLSATGHATHCPFKGDASYWTIGAGGRTSENAVWGYEDPFVECARLEDHVAFYWNKVDRWYEEDDEIFVHARDPYKRVDVVRSSRPVKVILGGETVAESVNARFLFETGLPTRYYLPPGDVRRELLTPSDAASSCPYKGNAVYWTAAAGGRVFENIVWSYPEPIPEMPGIKGLMCFFNEKVDDILIDGVSIEKVETPWS
ncbi:MAG: DUF427 domain-containing protein [Rhodospirillales bacterium]|nr:DUF427 domain-containing protein [Rhodospirillales bacterium]